MVRDSWPKMSCRAQKLLRFLRKLTAPVGVWRNGGDGRPRRRPLPDEAQHAAQAVARDRRPEVGGEQVGGVATGVVTGG